MESTGIVKSTAGSFATVMIEFHGGCCEHCEKETCDAMEQGVETEALNAVGALPGQKVKVSMEAHTYIKGALILYILPLLALLGGAVAGSIYLPAYFSGNDSQLPAVIGGFAAFLVSMIPVKILASRMEKKMDYRSVIESIIS